MVWDSGLKSVLALACAVSLLSACDMKSNLDDMHKATNEMKDTTKRMEEKTSDLDKKSGALDSKTAELYDALRQGNGALMRKEFLDAMNSSKEMPKKLALGVKYFWAFEFQLWSMQGLDDDARREELESSGAREFIREIQEFVPSDEFIEPTTDDNYKKNFLALAAAMHEINDKQKTRVDPKGLPRVSMLSLFEKALEQNAQLKAGTLTVERLAPSSYDLLSFESKMIQVLQARHNMILAMLVAQASHVNADWKTKVKLGLLGMKWNLDLSKYNDAEIAALKKYTKGIRETRAILTKYGYPVLVDGTLQKILGNGQVVKSAVKIQARQTIESDLAAAFEEIKAAKVEVK